MTKVKLDHAHALDLLRGMIRIRRFEEKSYELYTQEHIRGFLHLMMVRKRWRWASLRRWRTATALSRPTANTATRWRAA